MPEPYQLAPYSVKVLLVYSLWLDQTSQSVVKGEPSYPAEEAHFLYLYLPSHYYLVTMQSSTGRRVIYQLRFYTQLSLPHTRVAQRWYRYDTSLSVTSLHFEILKLLFCWKRAECRLWVRDRSLKLYVMDIPFCTTLHPLVYPILSF